MILALIVAQAIQNSIRIYDALIANAQAVYSPSFQTGKVLSSTSGNGQAAAMEPGVSARTEWNPVNALGLDWVFISILQDTLTNNPTLADDASASSSQAILALMQNDDRMQPVTRRGIDVTLLNFPQTGQLATTGG